jgi:uncharacterized protein
MGLTKIYLDSCIVIYFVEKHALFSAGVTIALNVLTSSQIYYSPLVRMECLIKPLHSRDLPTQKLYEKFWLPQQLLSLPAEIFDLAAQLRADHKSLKTPDAIHLATALYYGCDELWTNDDRLGKIAPAIARNILTT